MTFKETMARIFSTSEGTYYKWKKEDRPIINLLDKYFKKEELEEFLETGEILKLEFINDIDKMHAEIVKKISNNMNKFEGKSFSNADIHMCLNTIEFKILEKGDEVTQLEMIKFLIDKDNDELLDIKDENTRCALISSLSILNELEFKIFKRESFYMI